jgi:hypothetical protein
MSICSTGMSREERGGAFNGSVEPLVVKPAVAWRMLSCSNTRGYELLAAGKLRSFKDGKSRKIIVASIRAYIDELVAAQEAE